MKTAMFALLTSAAVSLCCAPLARSSEPPRSRFGNNPGHNAVLKDVVPQEFGRFTTASARGANAITTAAVLNLVSKADRILVACNRNPRGERTEINAKAETAYMFAWEKAIQTWKKSTDDRVRAKIMAAWNSGLKESPEVQWQIKGLWSEWHPAFVTDSFVKLFKATSDPAIVGAFIGVLGDYGQDAEEALLREKLTTITGQSKADKMNVEIIDVALKQIGCWRAGDPTRIGPAALSHK